MRGGEDEETTMKRMDREHCPPIEELESKQWQAHVAECPFCQMDRKMLLEFEEGTPTVVEQRDVTAIVEGLRRGRVGVAPVRTWRDWFAMPMLPRLVGGLAVLVLLVAVSTQWTATRRSELGGFEDTGVARSGLEIRVEPQGDLAAVPAEWTWTAVDGAVRYEVRVMEVDGTLLTEVATDSPKLLLPEAVRAAMLPKKTILLEIRAVDGGGKVVAQATQVKVRLEPEFGLKVK